MQDLSWVVQDLIKYDFSAEVISFPIPECKVETCNLKQRSVLTNSN
jgi:hypothetical protein